MEELGTGISLFDPAEADRGRQSLTSAMALAKISAYFQNTPVPAQLWHWIKFLCISKNSQPCFLCKL
jgi:hypothetical protein